MKKYLMVLGALSIILGGWGPQDDYRHFDIRSLELERNTWEWQVWLGRLSIEELTRLYKNNKICSLIISKGHQHDASYLFLLFCQGWPASDPNFKRTIELQVGNNPPVGKISIPSDNLNTLGHTLNEPWNLKWQILFHEHPYTTQPGDLSLFNWNKIIPQIEEVGSVRITITNEHGDVEVSTNIDVKVRSFRSILKGGMK